MTESEAFHLHLETQGARHPLFHMTRDDWDAAAARHPALAGRLRASVGFDGDILDHALKTADFMINSAPPTERLRERAPKLKWIQTTGAGIEPLLPLDWLPPDVTLTNNSGAHGPKAEDSCTMALLMLQSRMPEMVTNQRERRWEPIYAAPIAGRTAVIVGFGDLGKAAGRAAKKLDVRVIAVTRSGKAGAPADEVVGVGDIDSVLPRADFLVVTTPLTPETHGLVSRARLDLLKRGAGVINIGRSPIMDYAALFEKLANGAISGAVLDVFDEEPLPPHSPVWTVPNLVVMPHISCDDPRYIAQLLDTWFGNFERFLAGQPLLHTVDRTRGY